MPASLTPAAARASAQAWCDAWNRRDLDAIMQHYAEDVAFSSPTVIQRWGTPDGWLHGRDRLRAHFEIGLRTPNLSFSLVDVLLGAGAMCVLYLREAGILVTDLVELDDEGRGRRVVACYGEPLERQASPSVPDPPSAPQP